MRRSSATILRTWRLSGTCWTARGRRRSAATSRTAHATCWPQSWTARIWGRMRRSSSARRCTRPSGRITTISAMPGTISSAGSRSRPVTVCGWSFPRTRRRATSSRSGCLCPSSRRSTRVPTVTSATSSRRAWRTGCAPSVSSTACRTTRDVTGRARSAPATTYCGMLRRTRITNRQP